MNCQQDTDMDDAKLLERLRVLYPDREMREFNILDVIHAEGSPLLALLYGRLFWPEFVEIDGMVFLKETVEDDDDRRRLRQAFERYGYDRTQTEQSFNLVEVEDLFGNHAAETSEDEDNDLLEQLRQMWSARLSQLFPARHFRVDVVPAEQTGGSVGLLFWMERS
jgi:hypothetical protein